MTMQPTINANRRPYRNDMGAPGDNPITYRGATQIGKRIRTDRLPEAGLVSRTDVSSVMRNSSRAPMPHDLLPATPRIGHSACPHDCPSTCALEVELLGDNRIGRVHGAKSNTYTDGVICAKVARYAERIHHPDRLLHPLRRKGPKGSKQFERISWDDALDITAEAMLKAEAQARRRGGLAVFLRRHHGPRHARRHQPAAPRQEVFEPVLVHLHDARLDRLRRRHRDASPAPIRARWRSPTSWSSGAPTPSTRRST